MLKHRQLEEQKHNTPTSNTPREDLKMPRKESDTPLTPLSRKEPSLEISKEDNSDFIGEIREKKVSPEDFVAHTVLGKGSFGEVYLVQRKSHQEFYAMKILRKSKIMGRNLTR